MDGLVVDGWRVERRGRLLDAAARVFARNGYAQTSMDEIAQEAGVGKPTLYRYFPSKDELSAAVFAEALDGLERRLHEVIDTEPDMAARLRGLVVTLLPTFRDHLVTNRILGDVSATIDQSKRRVFRDRRARIAGFLSRTVERGMRDGDVRSCADPETVSHLLIGMIWSSAAAVRTPDPVIADQIVSLVLSGIGSRPADRTPRITRSREVVSA